MAGDILTKINFSNGRLFIFDFFPGSELSTIKLSAEIHRNGIKSAFIISSEPVDASSYIGLINFFKSSNINIKSHHVPFSYPENAADIQDKINEFSRVLAEGLCLIVSYSNSYARTFAAALIRQSAASFDEAVKSVSFISSGFDIREDVKLDLKFLKEYFKVEDKFEPYLELVGIQENEKAGKDDIRPGSKMAPLAEIEDKNERIPSGLNKPELKIVSLTDSEVRVESVSAAVLKPGEQKSESAEAPAVGDIIQVELSKPDKPVDQISGMKPHKEVKAAELQKTEEEKIEPFPEKTSDENKKAEKPETEIINESVLAASVQEEPVLEKEETKKEKKKREKLEKKEAKKQDIENVGIETKYAAADLTEGADNRTPFYISLKFKLISIISVIIILSLSGMIFLASYYFRKDNLIRIEENNLKLSEVTASRVFSELDKSRIIALTMLNELDAKENEASMVDFTRTDVLFAGIIDDKSGVKFSKKMYNTQLLSKFQIESESLDSVTESSLEVFQRAFAGETVVHNVSQSLDFPVLALVLPYKRGEGREIASIMVSYIKLDSLLKSFESRGTIIFFMVNSRGDVIAHPDPKVVLSGANYSKLSIVENMFKSKTDNGNVRYKNDKGVVYLGSFKKIEFGGSGVIAAVEEDKVLEEVNNLQRRNIYLMVIVLASAILIVFLYGRSITGPIVRLVGATREIIKGNFHINIKASSKDEIGNLTESFIKMGLGLEEREKIKDAFGKFVDEDLAEQVMKGTIKLGGERKEVAVFFSDIRSFTAISEKLAPEEVVEFLNQYMTRMVKCVRDTNGKVDKFIGDAIMAVWGATKSWGNDTENAVNGALMMRATLAEFNNGRGGDKHPVIRIGCGINTGPVLAGQIGSMDRMEYTVIGDTVNLASRIESLNKPFGTDILISEDAYQKVKGIFAVEKMQSIRVKGKSEPQSVYAVIRRSDDPAGPKTLSEVRILIGLDPSKFKSAAGKDGTFEDEEVKYEIIDK